MLDTIASATCERMFLLALSQAEREDVVKWLGWSCADPAKRSGNLLKMAQDPGQK